MQQKQQILQSYYKEILSVYAGMLEWLTLSIKRNTIKLEAFETACNKLIASNQTTNNPRALIGQYHKLIQAACGAQNEIYQLFLTNQMSILTTLNEDIWRHSLVYALYQPH